MRVYNPKLVTITFDNQVITGFSEDSMISIEKDEENHLPYDGVLGEHAVAKNANNNYTATISLSSVSPFVSILRKKALDDNPVAPFSCVNMNEGADDISTDSAYIIQAPEYIAGKEIEDIEIEIRLVNPQFS